MISNGTILNNTYRIIDQIGKGGGGIVYKAIHLNLNKEVVVKKIRDKVIGMVDIRREVDILKGLHHTYLPQVYDFIKIGNEIFTVIDFVPGQTLEYYINNRIRLNQKQAIHWMKQLGEALDYLHAQSPAIIHCDIKPANIIITPENNVCLIDFNISLFDSTNIRIGGISYGYASPELCQKAIFLQGGRMNDISIDTRTDIYSLGATYYHMLSLVKPPYNFEEIVPLTQYAQNYSEIFLMVVMRAMEFDRDKRYQTAAELLDALNNMHKLDKRAKKQRSMEYISTICGIGMISVFILIAVMGYIKMGQEDDERYIACVQAAIVAYQNEDYERAEGYFAQAILLEADSLSAYYERLLMLSQQRSYIEVISYGNEILINADLSAEIQKSSSQTANIYYIMANACFETEDYDQAVEYYKKAISLYKENPLYFRDYAITLSRLNDLEGAGKVLEEAAAYGLEADDISLVEGELALKRQNYSVAIEKLTSVLEHTDDEYIRARCYLLCATAYKENGDIENEISLLEEARIKVSTDYINKVLQQLGEAYARMAKQNLGQADDYNQKALDCYLILAADSYNSYQIQINIGTLYQSLGQYASASEIYEQLMDEFPNEYLPYIRSALLYCEEQSSLNKEKRDYTPVLELYEQAKSLFNASSREQTNSELENLEEIINDLYSSGWLE